MNFGKCVYDHEEEEDWLLVWNDMLNKHKLVREIHDLNSLHHLGKYARHITYVFFLETLFPLHSPLLQIGL